MKIYNHIMGKTSLSFAYRTIKENILRLDIKPGEELKEADSLHTLNMSRTPLREALILLKHDGLVEAVPQKGTFVTKIEKEKFEAEKLLRLTVEEKIFLMACENFPEEYLKKLEENLKKQKYIMDTSRDYVEFHYTDLEFHQLVFEGVGYKNLFELTNDKCFDYQRVAVLFCSDKLRDDFIFKGHQELYQIIKEKRKENVEKALSKHLGQLGEKLNVFIEEYSRYFKK